MFKWLLEFACRAAAVPLLSDVAGTSELVWLAATLVVAGSLPWLFPESLLARRIGFVCRRVQCPPSGAWNRPATALAGWSRLTFRGGVVTAALLLDTANAATAILELTALLWLVDGAAHAARWMRANRAAADQALGSADEARALQRVLDAATWTAMVPAMQVALVGLWRPAHLPELAWFGALLPLTALSVTSGQWLAQRQQHSVLRDVVRREALLVTAASIAGCMVFGHAALLGALACGQLLMSARRLPLVCAAVVGARPARWLATRVSVALLVAAPGALALAVLGALAPAEDAPLLAVRGALIGVLQGVSTVAWWTLASKRGW